MRPRQKDGAGGDSFTQETYWTNLKKSLVIRMWVFLLPLRHLHPFSVSEAALQYQMFNKPCKNIWSDSQIHILPM